MLKNIDLSLVLPVFNEEEVLPILVRELYSVCNFLNKNYEIIFVDDNSHDKTPEILGQFASKDPRIKVLRFSRNFGHQAALNAGIDIARGEAIITMDGDLQHPPHLIPIFMKHAQEGSDIVIGERMKNKQNSAGRELAGRLFYKFLSSITGLEFRNVSDFGLYNRSVVKVLKKLPERERYLRGMVQWIGFKKKYVPYVVESRRAGIPKHNIRKLAQMVLSGVTSFSAFPLRLAFWAGLFVLAISIIFSGYIVWDHYLNADPLKGGNATVVILILFLGSLQMMVLGIMGEYFYKMFNEVKGRPLYIVSEMYNIDRENIEQTSYGIHSF